MSLLPVDEALRRILAGAAPTAPETVPLDKAAGRVLAEPLVARRTQPPFPASAMDGYAVRSADASTGSRLRLIGESAAGLGFAEEVRRGETVRILTGAPVPAGADTILIQENATVEGDFVIVTEAPRPGRYIRPAGLDFSEGAPLLPAGRRMGAREMALAAAAGAAELPVRKAPRVAIVSIGDELVPPGATPGPDQIVASSAPAIVSLARAAGADAADIGLLPDRLDAVAEVARLAAGQPVDVLVTLAGVSVGTHDVARPALAKAGMELDFWQIAMRPGKPLMFGRLGGMAVLGLPGNPVSSYVCALLFLRPLIAAMLGEPAKDGREPALLGADLPANDQREDYVRARLEDRADGLPLATPLPRQDSSMLSALADADCLLIRPANAPAAPAGSPCRIIRL